MRAFLETNNGEWFDDYVYMSVQPLLRLDIQIIKAEELDGYFKKIKPEIDDIFIGSVEGTIAFWKQLGITPPAYLGYPVEFSAYYNRNISVAKFGSITHNDLPIFIKPKNNVKEFTGFVLEKNSTLTNINLYVKDISPDTIVYVSDPIQIESEYRCFVHKNKLVGMKHYAGDFTKFPDMKSIQFLIERYARNAPISYTLDVAVTEIEGQISNISVIEVNDFWAIGGYGLDGKTYVRMLIDRFQHIKQKHIIDTAQPIKTK